MEILERLMKDDNFYVRSGAGIACVMSSIGSKKFIFKCKKDMASKSGKIIGLGIKNAGTGRIPKEALKNLDNEDDFIRKCSVVSIALSNLGQSKDHVLYKKLNDSSRDVLKTTLLCLGLSNLGRGNKELLRKMSPYLKAEDWMLRAYAGLGCSLAFMGKGREYWKEFIKMLEKEKNSYVLVTACWAASTGLAGFDKAEEFDKLLRSKISYFRDMASLGLGFTCMKSKDTKILDIFEKMTKDKHPYVRESAYLGTGIGFRSTGNKKASKIIIKGFKDPCAVTRSGAGIAAGLINMNSNKLQKDLHKAMIKEHNPEVNWGFSIGAGLMGFGKGRDSEFITLISEFSKNPDKMVKWGSAIGLGFTYAGSENLANHCKKAECDSFLNFWLSMASASSGGRLERVHKEAVSLLLPGLLFYSVYESFWWGLWTLSELGAALFVQKGVKSIGV